MGKQLETSSQPSSNSNSQILRAYSIDDKNISYQCGMKLFK